jgi:hypothetical protein
MFRADYTETKENKQLNFIKKAHERGVESNSSLGVRFVALVAACYVLARPFFEKP